MSKSRLRLTAPVVATRAAAEHTLGELASLTAQRNGLRAELDSRLTALRAEYEGRIDELARQIEQRGGLLQQWAESAPEEFGTRKSLELLHGRLGFRTSPPALKTLSGWTWKKCLEILDEGWVRIKREADKEALLAATQRGDLDAAALRAVGLRVVQDEVFFVEPKLEETDAV